MLQNIYSEKLKGFEFPLDRRAKQQQQMDSSSKESPRSEDLLDSGSVVSTATTSTTTTNAMAGTPATMTIASSVPATGQVAQKADLVGLALSGFSDPNNVLWRATCADVLRRLNNPYLRVMFKFLSCCHSPTPGRSIKGFMDIVVCFLYLCIAVVVSMACNILAVLSNEVQSA